MGIDVGINWNYETGILARFESINQNIVDANQNYDAVCWLD
jgi:hypothetical protein